MLKVLLYPERLLNSKGEKIYENDIQMVWGR